MKKMAFSTSCSELNKMDAFEYNLTKHPQEKSMESLVGSSANVGAIVGEDITPSPIMGAAGRAADTHPPQKVEGAKSHVKKTADKPTTTEEKKKNRSQQTPKQHSNSNDIHPTNHPEKSRIPTLDRKISRNSTNIKPKSSQSTSRTGTTKMNK